MLGESVFPCVVVVSMTTSLSRCLLHAATRRLHSRLRGDHDRANWIARHDDTDQCIRARKGPPLCKEIKIICSTHQHGREETNNNKKREASQMGVASFPHHFISEAHTKHHNLSQKVMVHFRQIALVAATFTVGGMSQFTDCYQLQSGFGYVCSALDTCSTTVLG